MTIERQALVPLDGYGNWQRPVPPLPDFSSPREVMIMEMAAHAHAGEWALAGKCLGKYVAEQGKQKGLSELKGFHAPTTKEDVQVELAKVVNWALNSDRYELAAMVLWPSNMFDPRPYFTRMIWDTLKNSAAVMAMGSASASKSFSTGVWLMLDWLRDPENTNVRLLGPSEQHLEDNLFSHMVNLHQNAVYPLPGATKQLLIETNVHNKFGAIRGVIVPLGKKASGRLQGAKPGRRKTAHPVFGMERRMRVFMDESEKVPSGIWKDVNNIVSNTVGFEKFKIVCAFNPEDQNGESAQRCEPQEGWATFDIDTSERWRSKRGWDVVRLDGYKGENVQSRKPLYPGLQTYEGIQTVIRDSGGVGSSGYYTMARAAFPPQGATLTVVPQGVCEGARGLFSFVGTTTPVAGCDLALTGNDSAKFVFGQYGLASGFNSPPSLLYPKGKYTEFRNAAGKAILRPAAQVDQIIQLEKGDSVTMARQIRELCNTLSVQADCLCVDRTGHGQGVYDILRSQFGQTHGVNYTESATEMKILEEDSDTPKEVYERVCSELYFALRKWFEYDLMKISPMVSQEKLFSQLSDRRYHTGKRLKVEAKDDYKDRNGGKSPDDADGVTLFLHSVRKRFGAIPSLKRDKSDKEGAGSFGDEYEDGEEFRVDVTNRQDEL